MIYNLHEPLPLFFIPRLYNRIHPCSPSITTINTADVESCIWQLIIYWMDRNYKKILVFMCIKYILNFKFRSLIQFWEKNTFVSTINPKKAKKSPKSWRIHGSICTTLGLVQRQASIVIIKIILKKPIPFGKFFL